MAVNLKELSARLGLSPTTVSRALGGYADVSASTRERVKQVALELDYQPNRAARQIARGRADAVGIVYSLDAEFLGNPSFLETLNGLATRLEQSGLDLLLGAASQQGEMQIYERMVRGQRVDAMLVAHTLVEDPRIEYLLRSEMPLLAYGRTAQPERFPWFDFDNAGGMSLAVRRLRALGHRRIAYVHAPLRYNFAFQRHAGFASSMRSARLRVPPGHVIGAGLTRRSGYEAGRQLMALDPQPTAVIVDNANAGIGLLRALLDDGRAVGPDLSVVVYEGLPADTIFQGLQVASIAQPTPFESGRTMGDMMIKLLDGRLKSDAHMLRQPEFLDGNSVAPPPS